MKKFLIILVALIVIIGIYFVSVNNSLVSLEETINQNQAEIDNQLQRRADLIPNLVSTVKGLTSHEQGIIDSITAARQKMLSGSTQEKLDANAQLSTNINILMENYPTIKSDTSFISLMDELSGTENRIAVARKNYNDDVGEFNKKIKKFPDSMIASMLGFDAHSYLEVADEDKVVPNVEF